MTVKESGTSRSTAADLDLPEVKRQRLKTTRLPRGIRAPLGSRQDSLTRPDNPCEADASSRSTRAGARQHTKTRGSAAEREVDARIQHRSRDEARWGREPTSRREGMDRRPSSGIRWGSGHIKKAMPPTLASGQSSSSSSDLSGSRR